MITSLSGSICRCLHSLLRLGKSNALRLDEIFPADLLYTAALTPTQLVINRASPQTIPVGSMCSPYIRNVTGSSWWRLAGWLPCFCRFRFLPLVLLGFRFRLLCLLLVLLSCRRLLLFSFCELLSLLSCSL